MANLLDNLRGPFFDFLVVGKDSYWERTGRVGRIIGIKPEYYRDPDALRIPDATISVLYSAFRNAKGNFDYHGYTEYDGDYLDHLIEELIQSIEILHAQSCESDFRAKLTELFVDACDEALGCWGARWTAVRNALVEQIRFIVSLAQSARGRSKVFLVLGV